MSTFDDAIFSAAASRTMRRTSSRAAISKAPTIAAADIIIVELRKVSDAAAASFHVADAALTTARAVANCASIKACDLQEADPQSSAIVGSPAFVARAQSDAFNADVDTAKNAKWLAEEDYTAAKEDVNFAFGVRLEKFGLIKC